MAKFEIFADVEGEYRWRLLSATGELIAESSGGYEAKALCQVRIDQVKKVAAAAFVEDLTARPGGSASGPLRRPRDRWAR